MDGETSRERCISLCECRLCRRQVDVVDLYNLGYDCRFLLWRRVMQLLLQNRSLSLKSLHDGERMRRSISFILTDRRQRNDDVELGRQQKPF